MTFAELYAAAVALVPSDTIAVQAEAWHHGRAGRKCLEWSIWVSSHCKHYTGSTPEQALLALQTALAHPLGACSDADIAAVGPSPEVAS